MEPGPVQVSDKLHDATPAGNSQSHLQLLGSIHTVEVFASLGFQDTTLTWVSSSLPAAPSPSPLLALPPLLLVLAPDVGVPQGSVL